MKWEHGVEDDIDYGKHNLDRVNKDEFVEEPPQKHQTIQSII